MCLGKGDFIAFEKETCDNSHKSRSIRGGFKMGIISEKLKLAKYDHIVILNMPADVAPLFSEIQYQTKMVDGADFVLDFVVDLPDMRRKITALNKAHQLTEKGYFFVAYPKVQSKQYSGIKRDDIFPFLHVNEATGQIGETQLKFSRMLKLDDDFTMIGMQWLTAKPRKQGAINQRVADYQDRVPELEAKLESRPAILTQFQQLTPGYQREWARYIFATKATKIAESHFDKMIEVLAAGYPSISLYRMKK